MAPEQRIASVAAATTTTGTAATATEVPADDYPVNDCADECQDTYDHRGGRDAESAPSFSLNLAACLSAEDYAKHGSDSAECENR
jgi:hypothetical protein